MIIRDLRIFSSLFEITLEITKIFKFFSNVSQMQSNAFDVVVVVVVLVAVTQVKPV